MSVHRAFFCVKREVEIVPCISVYKRSEPGDEIGHTGSVASIEF